MKTKEELVAELLEKCESLKDRITEQRADLVLAIENQHGVTEMFEHLCDLQKEYRETKDQLTTVRRLL